MITAEFKQEYSNPETDLVEQHVVRRSRMETFCDILRAVSNGAVKPTHIMYKANLSWAVMNMYVRSLEKQGLLETSLDQGKTTYHLSQKGYALLSEFTTIREELRLPIGK